LIKQKYQIQDAK